MLGLDLGIQGLVMEENEVEEGEAFCNHKNGDCVDPDVALSYIDEKLQNALGHFQKDFEGGVSAENLGAKFGGYGSFLPSYPRSPPTLFQSPPVPQNHTISKSPYSSSVENPSVTRNTSVSKDDTALVAQPINPGRNNNHIGSFSSWECDPKLDSSDKQLSNGDQKSLKVRIKVGSDNTLSQNNAAIYSGLGLDTPPSSSDDSLDASPGLSSAFQSAPGESPLSILQAMTCFSVPGGYLISPLHEYLCQLTENGYQALLTKGMNFNCKGDVAKTLKKETDIANTTNSRINLSVLNTPLQSCSRGLDQKAERQVKCNLGEDSNRAFKASKLLNNSEEDRFQLPNSSKSVKIIGSSKSSNGTTKFNEKHKSITCSAENNFEDRNPSNQKKISSDALSGGKGKNQKSSDDISFNVYEHESGNDHVSEHGKSMKQMSSGKYDIQEKFAEELIQENGAVQEGNRRHKPSINNYAPSIESIHAIEGMRSSSSLVSKEKKKSSHANGDHSEIKVKTAKSRTKFKKDHSGKSYRDQDREHLRRTERSMERLETMKDVGIQPETIKSTPSNNFGAAVELIVPPTGVIEDSWVCCDKCQKWRLLPHGQNPVNLPKEWKCSMQDWLPGLNKCAVPEEETTKAFNALFVVPATEHHVNLNGHHDVITSRNTSMEEHHHGHQINTTEKNQWKDVVASNLPKHSISENHDATLKAKSSTDVNDYLLERNSSANTFTGPTSKAMHITDQNNYIKEKPEIRRRYSDEGNITGKADKHTKSKHKRDINQDGSKSSKKCRKENSGFTNKTPDRTNNSLSDVQYSDSLDYAAKKRKVKEWQESQVHQDTTVKSQRPSENNRNAKETLSEGEPRKQKKSMVSKFEGMESKMNEVSGNKNINGRIIQSISSGNDSNRDLTYVHLPTTATSSVSKVSKSSNSKSRSRSKTNLHEARSSPVESVSSSPLRNSSIEKKYNRKSFESNGVMVNVDHSLLASPKFLSNGEPCIGKLKYDKNYMEAAELKNIHVVGESENILNHDDDDYDNRRSNKNSMDDNQDNLNSPHQSTGNGEHMSNKSAYGFNGRNQSSNSYSGRDKLKASNSYIDKKEVYSTKHGSNCTEKSGKNQVLKGETGNFLDRDADELLEEKTYCLKQSNFDISDNHNYNGLKNISDTKKASSKSEFQENVQQVPLSQCKNPVKREVSPLKNKSEARDTGLQTVTPVKGSSSNLNVINASKQSRHQNNLRQTTPNVRDPSPMRKDGHSRANAVIKEARDLKHTANRLKNEGLNHESNGLYFEAALKFLLGASLLEPSNEETNPSIQMMNLYSETAKFFEYCAFEYERHKEMAAAALAYKCAEVAYMKVAYYRHPGASKDRHELQAALQTTIPGESPSSSASDIDNLNNQSALDKAVLTKATASPNIAGNHVIAARSRPSFTRLLTYTNDLNCAFDATKRSQIAIAAATASLDEDKVDGLLSVKKVLDFNFHNIEGLLHLVRISVDLITP